MLLLRNKDREYNNPLASFATCLCWQRSKLRICVKRVGGLAVTTLPQAHNQGGSRRANPSSNFFALPGKMRLT